MSKEKPTEKELADYRNKMIEHMDEQLPFLKKQHEYEKLRSEIASFKFNQLVCKVKTAEMIPEKTNTDTDGKSENN